MKKVGLLSLALVLCLAVIGIGYASWTKDLYINGTVTTGTLDAVWVEATSWDSEPPEKDYSSITCVVDPSDAQQLTVTVTNAYPCIDYYNQVQISNIGTIPLHITGIALEAPAFITAELLDANEMPPTLPLQLHPGESVTMIIRLHLMQSAPQGQTVTMSGSVNTVQWNAPAVEPMS